jgi:Mg/Co/Ni transporter MgtE
MDEFIKNPSSNYIYVVDDKDVLLGIITLRDILRITAARYQIHGKGFKTFLTYISKIMKDDVDDMMRPPLSVTPNDALSKAMKIMESYDLTNLPVVDKKTGKLLGELNGVEILKFAFEGIKRTDMAFLKVKKERELKKKRSRKKKGRKK